MKMRVNRGQEFVIGGYTIGTKTFDALIPPMKRSRTTGHQPPTTILTNIYIT